LEIFLHEIGHATNSFYKIKPLTHAQIYAYSHAASRALGQMTKHGEKFNRERSGQACGRCLKRLARG
jgi:hypothetical protein